MMKDIKTIYEDKKCSVEEALSIIESGDRLVTSVCANEPFTILSQLHSLKDRGIRDLHIMYSLGNGKYEFLLNEAYREFIDVESFFFGAANRLAHKERRSSYVPVHLHQAVSRRGSHREPNVYIGSVTPMDQHGYVRTSLTNMYDSYYLAKADKIILEVNPNLPYVEGNTEIHVSRVDCFVEVNTPIPTIPQAEIGKEDAAIGGYIGGLIRDGDTLQLGIGGIPDAVALALSDKQDLGIHTEMINSGMAKLMDMGVVTNRRKTFLTGKTVGAFAFGDRQLYDALDRNPAILMLGGEFVNDPAVIAQNDNMVSINTALQVDLTGQASSETIGSRHYSGTGGQTDTALGANHARNGRAIIALRSTTKNGTLSTIQPCLSPGAVVSLSRNNVDFIVTEYGIAAMKGRSVKERVNNLIAVAHPDFRQELRKEAERYMLW